MIAALPLAVLALLMLGLFRADCRHAC